MRLERENYMSKPSVEGLDRLSRYTTNATAEQMNYAVNISTKYKYVYIETPKVACSTIKLTLQRYELGDDNFRPNFDDVHNRSLSPLLSLQNITNIEQVLEGDSFFRFCFVRNPYIRTLSAYLDKIRNPFHKSIIVTTLGYDEDDVDIHISFEEFVTALEKQLVLEMNPHWRHQYYSTYQDRLSYHFIGHLESFENDFSYVTQRLGASRYYKSEYSHATSSSSLFSQYYTDDLMERVYRLFKIDFDTFDYSMEVPCR